MNPFKKELSYFIELAKTLNISQASEKIGVQQAGISKALKNLENELGYDLFYRTNRGLILTPRGKILESNLTIALDTWNDHYFKDQKIFERISGQFSIGMHPTLAQNFSPRFLPNICEKYPELDVQITLNRSSIVTRQVIDHEIHFGIVANPIKHPDLVIKKLAEEYIACWSRDKSPKRKVLYYNPDMIEIARRLKNFKEYKKVPIQDYEVIASNMRSAEGIALLPSSVTEKFPFLYQYQSIISKVKICLVYRHDLQKSAAFKVVLDEIKDGLN